MPTMRWFLAWSLAGCLLGADLQGAIDRMLASQVPAGGRSSVVVYDLGNRKLLYSLRGGEQFIPASLAKLIVSAAALLELGPDFTFRTRLVAVGDLANGTLPGLGILADGDPCLDTHFYPDKPDTPFLQWIAQLRARGIRRIAGDIVVDRSRFTGPQKPTTYPQDHENQQSWFCAPASALAWNDNCLEVRVVPAGDGQPCKVEVRPQSSRVQVKNLTKGAAKADNRLIVNRDVQSNHLTVSGTYSRATDWFALAIHHDADLLAADHFKRLLVAGGIAVDGSVIVGKVAHDALTLVEDGHRLGPAIDILNQRSQNFYGEQILRVLGLTRRRDGSVLGGCTAVAEILRQHIAPDLAGWTLLDGCGLSYTNQACADLLARLLAFMDAHPQGPTYRASLKPMEHAGVKGQVKTGTLAVARGLAGYLDTPDGRKLCFVVMLNKGEARTTGWMVGLREKLFATICENL